MLRDNCNDEELWAHRVLDKVKLGLPVTDAEIRRALFVLGDSVGLKD